MSDSKDFQVVDEKDLPRGSILKPVQLSINVLKDKYKGVKKVDVMTRFVELSTQLNEIQIQLRELNVLEGYNRMNETQKELQHVFETDMEFLKEEAEYNNIVAMSRNEVFDNIKERTNSKD